MDSHTTPHATHSLNRQHWLLCATFLVAIAAFVAQTTTTSSAATYSSNPVGYADYCTISGTVTTIHGWAYDPEAPAGAQPYVKVNVTNAPATANLPSNIAGYRDTPINTSLNTRYPGAPHPGTYGWVLSLPNLYKGTTYTISGTVLNYSAGANVALLINSTRYVEGDSTKPYFVSNKIPDSCLMPVPVPATPTPTTPAPTPPKPTTTAPKPAATSPTAAVSSAADGTVTTGTTTAVISVPAGSATSIHLLYGIEPTTATAAQTVSGTSTTITLKNLQPKTTYKYQIVRTLGAQTATSPAAIFTTSGYTITLGFTAKDNRSVKGIKVELNGTTVTSDANGVARFDNLDPGAYIPKFTYIGHTYTQEVIIRSDAAATDGQTTVTKKTVNLDTLKLASSSASANPPASSSHSLAIFGALAVAALVFGAWLIRRFVSNRLVATSPTYDTDMLDQPSAPLSEANAAPVEAQPHTGISLKDMVMESMHEQTKHHDQDPPDPAS